MNNLKFRRTKRAFGVELEINDYHVISERFEALKEMAPAVSVSHLNFEKRDKTIYGVIKIRSLNLDFESTYDDLDIIKVYNYLEIDILDQLNAWKKTRFQATQHRELLA